MTTADFLQKYNNMSTGLFRPGQVRGIESDDHRAFVVDIMSTFNDIFMLANFVPSTTGTNTYVGSTPVAMLSYAPGAKFLVKFSEGSTDASTLNLSLVGAKKIYINPTTQAGAGHIVDEQTYLLEYVSSLDAGNGGFLIISGGTGDSMTSGGAWNFAANSGNFPTSPKANVTYIADDDHGSFGDADYVAAGTWMLSKTAGANSFSGYYYK